MKKVVAFGASSSTKSINQQLANWAANQIEDVTVKLLDLNDFEMPIYSMDREQENGIPNEAKQFKDELRSADGIVISFAEHNGSYSTAFKNIYDWASRIEKSIWLDKPVFLLATSPGARGGQTVLATAANSFLHQGAQVKATFSLPSFFQSFDQQEGIKDNDLLSQFNEQLGNFKRAIQ